MQQISSKWFLHETRLGWKGDLKWTVQEIKNWQYEQRESVLENKTHKILWDFKLQTDHVIAVRRPEFLLIKKEKQIVFAVKWFYSSCEQHREKKDE